DHPQVRLVAGPARDDEHVPVAEARAKPRQLDAGREALGLVAQVEQGVLGERLERLRQTPLVLGERSLERRRVELGALGEERAVAPDVAPLDPDELAVGELVEERCTRGVDQPDPCAHELERAGVGKAARGRRRDVDDDPHAALDQLLGRDAVEIGVVDDRHVLGPEPPDEVLGAPSQARRPGDLAVHRSSAVSAATNSSPPSMRSSSPLRSALSSAAMRVWVGSPGTFSTRKCWSATLAICGRCVIVSTCARSASRRSTPATRCAVSPPTPASISSSTTVSPPATAVIASAMRESSPPDAVSATGASGRPAFGRTRNTATSDPVGPGSREPSS